MEDSLNLGLTPLKSTLNAEHFIRMQVVLVYLECFRCNSLLKCVLQPKIAKNLLKKPFLGFKVVQGHRCWYPRKARQQCCRSKSVFICNHSRARLVDSSRNRTFSRGYPNLMRSYGGLLQLGGQTQTLHRWNLRLMPNISYAGCPGLSWMVLAQFILKICIAAENRWKFTKTPILGVH